jgi:hypothetical protein
MGLLGFVGLLAIVVGAWWWIALPRLRTFAWWPGFTQGLYAHLASICSKLWALTGNSRTILVAYAAELLGMLDEAKLLDWSALVGSERAGRVMVVMGVVMIVLRLITRAAVSFKAEA